MNIPTNENNSRQKIQALDNFPFLYFPIQWTNPVFFFLVYLGQTASSWIGGGAGGEYFPNSEESTVRFAPSKSKQNATKISVLTGDNTSWHRKVLQELSLQVMVDSVSVEYPAFIFPLFALFM